MTDIHFYTHAYLLMLTQCCHGCTGQYERGFCATHNPREYVYTCVNVYTRIYIYICPLIYAHSSTFIYTYIYICTLVCVCICKIIYAYIYSPTYTHGSTRTITGNTEPTCGDRHVCGCAYTHIYIRLPVCTWQYEGDYVRHRTHVYTCTHV